MAQVRMIYASVARETSASYDELAQILRTSCDNNTKLGVTGILCYARGCFLQALEGEREIVQALYTKISADPRHRDCRLLLTTPIETRYFAEWSMRLVALETGSDLYAMTGAEAEAVLRMCAADGARPPESADFSRDKVHAT